MKRGYFVWADDYAAGFAVVATSTREAKMIAYNAELHSDYDWIEVRCRWVRHAAVNNLSVGMVEDTRNALIRGLYGSIVEYPCDECGGNAEVKCYHGRVLCDWCIKQSEGKTDET